MNRCPTCAAAVPAASRFCNSCGRSLEDSATLTMAPSRTPSSSQHSSEEGRFPASTILGERYRILGLLGRGGMGEVYRAFDLKLDQTVALKFLPAATARDPRLLERFRGEVRIARQVSHRNVCRVHDIGEADGSAFISMEYVDGEDLGSLLKQIGRMPPDKAIEIARKLCAGLAAAHEKGVLHRDLKPANIMLDSQGHVLIMDFGLAAAAGAIAGGDIRSGTPAYMAPEQKEGREVTVRSDIYSLGMVLHEIVTGKRPGDSVSMTKDVDPAMEKVIQRCLDPTPRNRPSTALEVARALPGGDPLAEALAAGDTPSPELVAASEDTGAVSVRTGVACLAFILVGLVVLAFLGGRTKLVAIAPFPESPQALEVKARDVIARAGYPAPPADSVYGFAVDPDYNQYAQNNLKPEVFRAQVVRGQPPLGIFWYRQSPQPMATLNYDGVVGPQDPPLELAGMADVTLNPQGRLRRFRAVPDAAPTPAPNSEVGRVSRSDNVDWSQFFTAAGLDITHFTPAPPERLPLSAFDTLAAWVGAYPTNSPSDTRIPLRIEAASWQGRAVYFQLVEPWRRDVRQAPAALPSGLKAALTMVVVVVAGLLLGALLLAWRNHRHERGDLHGSSRLAAFMFLVSLPASLLAAHHVVAINEFSYLINIVGWSLAASAVCWVLYMALEPYVRRRWPQSLISWTRLLTGALHDPLVGGHVLIGLAQGIAMTIVLFLVFMLPTAPVQTNVLPLSGLDWIASNWLGALALAVVMTLVYFFLFFLLRALLRRNWIAALAFAAVLEAPGFVGSRNYFTVGIAYVLLDLFSVWILLRFGVLAFVVATFVSALLGQLPFTLDLSAWYASGTIVTFVTVVVLAVWSFRVALGGRQVWKEDFLDR